MCQKTPLDMDFGPFGPFWDPWPLFNVRILDPFGPFWDPWPLYFLDLGTFWDILGHFSKKCPKIGTFFDQLFLKKSTSHKVLAPSHYAKKMRIWILSISTFKTKIDFSPTS